MMVELLLVIAVAVILIYLGLERYRAYYQSMQFDLVQSDIATIRESLNRFYTKIPCDASGVLQSPLDKDVIDELDTVVQRVPYVDRYHAYIIDSGSRTKKKKPVYQLTVTADINSRYQSLFNWLTQRLHATRRKGQTIFWISLPSNTMMQPSNLWVMNTSLNQFRNLTNDRDLAAEKMSHSYCFR